MRRVLLYVLILAALLLAPVQGTDVGKLRPAESVILYKEKDLYVIETDTGDLGTGKDVYSALENLKETTPAEIYLDTADYLLVSQDALSQIEQLRGKLRKSVQIYEFIGLPDMKKLSQFLRVHGNGPNLREWENGIQLPVVDCTGERMKIL